MRLTVLCVLFCCAFPLSSLASNLPPEHESARLLLVIEEAVNQGDWQLADNSLTQIASLQVDLPTPFFYYNGLVHSQLKRYEKAQRSLEHYAVKSGPSGSFYYESLRLLTSIENAKSEPQSTSRQQNIELGSDEPRSDEPSESPAILVNEERDTYIQTLKALFLTDSPIQALVMQINSLLSAHAYTGARLKKVTEKQGVKFRISIEGNVILLQETSYQDGFPRLSASRLEVSGLDPFITYKCNSKTISCWLYHPASRHDTWLVIDNDELVADELSQALTRLIQFMQK